ncbi:MAG TPA: signal recognition particle receptor subunit alpha, partial [Candidatus Limnocylindrales bacterium]|nr:signal recognition particle receptor subunit alpha [Candidatus Limnocylindrales bacterium]
MRLWRRLAGEEEPDPTGEAATDTPPAEVAGEPEAPAEPPDLPAPEVAPVPEVAPASEAVAGTSDEPPTRADPPAPVIDADPGGEPAPAVGDLVDRPVPDDPAVLEPRFEEGLERSRSGFMSRLRGFLTGTAIDPATWEEVEETLIAGDVGGALAMEVVERARERHDAPTAEAAVRAELAARLVAREPGWVPAPAVDGGPAVILVVGVNGTGKTTTIAKLAHLLKAEGKQVLLAAGDTFRAAAVEQLVVWA